MSRPKAVPFFVAAVLLTVSSPPAGRAGEIHKAAAGSDAALVESLIRQGAKVEAMHITSGLFDRPLHFAARSGSVEIVALLLEHGADVDTTNSSRETPLHYAARAGRPEILTALIEAGATVDSRDSIGRTPLHWSAHSGDEVGAEVLLASAADNSATCIRKPAPVARSYAQPTAPKGSTQALLQGAATSLQNQRADRVARLHGDAGEFGPAFWGRKPVGVARAVGHQAVVDLLEWRSGRTELHDAAGRGTTDAIEQLLGEGADVNARIRGFGWTPLHFAAERGHADAVALLLERGAEVDAANNRSWTPLHAAARNGRLETVRALLTADADVGAIALSGLMPLHLAAVNGDSSLGEALIDHDAEVSAVTDDGSTPLHRTAKYGKPEFARLLIERRANVGARDNSGETALHWAARYGQIEVVEALLSHGAEANARNNEGRTPLKLAKKNPQGIEKVQKQAVIALLKSKGAKG